MWFRIEIEQNLFAGFSLFDMEAEPQDGYSKGYQVNEITEGLINEACKYLVGRSLCRKTGGLHGIILMESAVIRTGSAGFLRP